MRRISVVGAVVASLVCTAWTSSSSTGATDAHSSLVSVYRVSHPRGVLATTGGWAYCVQLQALARRLDYVLACGRYWRDGYTGYGLRRRRMLDWGDPTYLASFAARIRSLHREVGGELALVGVSYSGFGVAELASHHPELRPNRLIVIDSFLDLVARRAAAQGTTTAAEIDAVTGGARATLDAWNVNVDGLARLVRDGTTLTVVWSIAAGEQREFKGATCGVDADAATLTRLAAALGRPVTAWVTHSRHGHDLWDSGRRILAGRPPGKKVVFVPAGGVAAGSTC